MGPPQSIAKKMGGIPIRMSDIIELNMISVTILISVLN
jgi:hypothetical protein